MNDVLIDKIFKRCTSKVKGIIKGYSQASCGGENSPTCKIETKYKDGNQILEINKTSNFLVDIYNNPIEQLYPINSEIDVYYDSKSPK